MAVSADMADSFLNEDSDHRAIASADPAEIDAEIIDAVWKAATLWSEVYKTLKENTRARGEGVVSKTPAGGSTARGLKRVNKCRANSVRPSTEEGG